MSDALHVLELSITKTNGKVDNNTKSIDEIKVNMKEESTQVWNTLFEFQKTINKLVWKIFAIVTIPLIFLIIMQFFNVKK